MAIWSMKMKTIKETLDNLKDHERQQLMYGFEHEFAQYVCLDNGTFIGVNVENIQHLEIKEKERNVIFKLYLMVESLTQV